MLDVRYPVKIQFIENVIDSKFGNGRERLSRSLATFEMKYDLGSKLIDR